MKKISEQIAEAAYPVADRNISELHPCEIIYHLSSKPVYGDITGTCRITGKDSVGISFEKWVKPTFTEFQSLKPGSIISNEALFCFDEASAEIQSKTGRDKLQRFRTYSHVVINGEWHCFTKAHKKEIYAAIVNGAELVSLTDSGQKHILFKHRLGFWQLDEMYLDPDIERFRFLHSMMCALLELGFSQTQIITGNYFQPTIIKVGLTTWKQLEDSIKPARGSQLFDFCSWMLFTNNQ